MNPKERKFSWNKEKIPDLIQELEKRYVTPAEVKKILEFETTIKLDKVGKASLTTTISNIMNKIFDSNKLPLYNEPYKGYRILTPEILEDYELKHRKSYRQLLKEAEENFNKEW